MNTVNSSVLRSRLAERIATVVASLSLLSLSGALAWAGLSITEPQGRTGERAAAVSVQTCTAQNIAGYPYSGTLCGGSVIDDCTPGFIYNCTGGPRGTTNNCTLSTNCSVGCLTGNNSTPVTVNTQTPTANDACFNGSAPLTLSSSSIVGGNNVTLTANLTATHSPYAIVNLNGLGNLVAQPCNVPIELLSTANSISLVQPTAVVTSTSQASLWTLISYTDAQSGKNRNLVSVTTPLTLQPGGQVVVPPLASFNVTDFNGNPITTVAGGANAFTQGTLSGPAPFGGVNVTVTTSPAGAFTTNGSFTVAEACTSNGLNLGTLTATSSATSNIAATVTANSGAGASITKSIIVTPPPLAINTVTLNPSTVTGGNTSMATVTLNRAVNATDPPATVSIRVSEGAISGTQIATFPGCNGSPACTGTVTIPMGASSISVTLSTSTVTTQDFVTVSADATWSNTSASANLTINPTSSTPTPTVPPTPTPTASATATPTPPTSVTLSSLTLNPTSVRGGNSSTGTVTLSGAAPNGGAVVALSSSNTTVATVPASVTVTTGGTSASFAVSTQRVNSNTTITISGSYGGATQSASLTVTSRH
jgi:hypothetical protein